MSGTAGRSSRILLIALILVMGMLSGCNIISKAKDAIYQSPDSFRLVDHSADLGKTIAEGRYKNALHLSAVLILDVIDYADDVVVEIDAQGITFSNPALSHNSGSGNRFIRIGYRDGEGILDLTALKQSGRIGVDVHGTIDLRHPNTTNNVAIAVKSAGKEISTSYRTRWQSRNFHRNEIYSVEMTRGIDNAYIEITIPQQGKFTLKDVFIYLETEVTGFTDMAERITGGAGAIAENIHRVSNASQFRAALDAAKRATPAPSIIEVAGTIRYADWPGSTRMFDLGGSGMSNLTVRGVGNDGIFDGIGMKIHGHNIIIENITIRKVLGKDGIEINNGTDIWIRHSSFYNEPMSINQDKDKFDELIAIKNDSQHIILSWNHFYDSHKTILIGSNDGVEALPDRKVIIHHNWFANCGSRMPLFRGGHGHIYNNYFENIGSGINTRTGSKLRIEANYFYNVTNPIGFWFDDSGNPSGKWEVANNIFAGSYSRQYAPVESTIKIDFGAYTYQLDKVEDVPSIVKAGAGAGKI